MLKILDGDKVYIPLRELNRKLLFRIEDDGIAKDIPGYGLAVSEADYNRLAQEAAVDGERFPLEKTRVESLRIWEENESSLMPLKSLFLYDLMGRNQEAVKDRLMQELKEEREKEIARLQTQPAHLASGYQKTVNFLQEHGKALEAKLDECGLVLQHITEVHENGSVGLQSYVAGKGIFAEMPLGDWTEEEIQDISRVGENGVRIPSPYDEGGAECVPSPNISRDFRQHTALENLAWCAQNLDVKNDFADMLTCRKDSIDVAIDIALLVKMLNRAAFREHLYLEGICKLEDDVVTAT